MSNIEAVILASGLSQRMGNDKLLLPLGNATIIGHFLSNFPYSLFARVIVVWSNIQVAEIAGQYPVFLCRNDSPERGKSHTIQLGLNAGNSNHSVMFSVADQPLLTAETIGRLVQLHQQCHQNIVQPHINGKPANPVIFPSDLRNELAALTNGSGGRELIHRHVDRVQTLFCSAVEEFHDIDTQEDYHQLVKKWQQMS